MQRFLSRAMTAQLLTATFAAAVLFYFYGAFIYKFDWLNLPMMGVLLVALLLIYRGRRVLSRYFSRISFSVRPWAAGLTFCVLLPFFMYAIAWYYDWFDVLSPSLINRFSYVVVEIFAIYTLYFVLVYLLGDLLVLRWTRHADTFTAFFARVGAGLIGVSLFGYAIASWQVLSIWWYAALLGFVIIARFSPFVELLKEVRSRVIRINLARASDVALVCLAVILFVYVSYLFFNSYQQFALDTDVLRSYYNAPRAFVESGGLVDFKYDYVVHTAKATEMLYMPLIYFSPYVVNYFMVFIFFLIIVFLYGFVKKISGANWATLATLTFIATPSIARFSKTLKVDLFLLFIFLLFYYCFYQWLVQRKKTFLYAAGVLFGFAVTVKYSALLMIPVLALIFAAPLFSKSFNRDLLVRTARSAALFFGIVILVASPWLTRNMVLYGSPVHPFLSPSTYIIDEHAKEVGFKNVTFIKEWSASFNEVAFRSSDSSPWYYELFLSVSGNSPRSFNQIGPLFLFLAIISLYGLRKRPVSYLVVATVLALWYQYALYSVWYLMYLIPLAVVVGIYSLPHFQKHIRTALVGLLIVGSLFGVALQLRGNSWAFKFWIGENDIHAPYFIDGPDLERVMQYINTNLAHQDPDYRIYAINFYMTRFIDESYKHAVPDPTNLGLSYVYHHIGTAEETKKFFVDKGIQYLLVSHPAYAQRLHDIDLYKNNTYRYNDILMIDELLSTSDFIYSDSTFYIVDLSTHHPRET